MSESSHIAGCIPRPSRGFTIVELVVTISLLGIISAVVFSRWFDSDAYRVNTTAAQIISQARLAQRIALANGDLGIHFQIAQSAGDWQLLIVQDDAGVVSTLHQIDVSATRIAINITAGIGPTALSESTLLDIEFNGLGDLAAVEIGGVQGSVTSGIAISLSGHFNQQLCLSPLGFAHNGLCV